ncbi:Long-chain-fatty-acid--CoA ligase 4 [Amphibalanus amphitrite]|uniref:long-chain-fatty-acid--CoA ligase n=1 Tax=Amphibalanus amphitrite TaxID=1232801 RepID=A0A6A4WQW0_AMPAM|nr:Long-chain-fatty-acid--CoA ligase 4 [Amphibalanus amphitrite]
MFIARVLQGIGIQGPSAMGETTVSAVVWLVSGLVFIYDVITLPLYSLVQWPWRQVRRAKRIRVVRHAIAQHGDKPCFGVREVLVEEDEKQPNGKIFKKYDLGEYRWVSYTDFGERAAWFGRGLRELGLSPGDRVVVFAETRAEWLISALAAFLHNITVVTLYTTLSEDAVVHGITETEVTHVITSHQLMKKMRPVLERCKNVTTVVYMEDQLEKTDTGSFRDDLRIVSFADVLQMGEHSTVAASPPTSQDVAILMYTSGSTGVPKGVLITHGNMVCTMVSFATGTEIQSEDIYLGYLPLAHVLELMGEMCCIMFGVPIGYSSPLTMMDTSSKVKRGCRGDCSVLKPTMVAAVPMVLDRVVQGIESKLQAAGPLAKALFNWMVEYRNTWRRRGFDTPIMHGKIAALLGGRVRAMASGGAPLSPHTHDLVRSCMGATIQQGYGLTETNASATLMDGDDVSVGSVGPPLLGCYIRLVDWEEGSYRTTDHPRPRGEIVIGGENVARGYYKLPEKTAESFFEEYGIRWFRTGDIGEMCANGNLRIVDRKKDLVKLQSGEYISLGRVETVLKTSPLVDNLFVYAESSRNNVVAVVLPNLAPLRQLARTSVGPALAEADLDDLCANEELEGHVQRALAEHGRAGRLDKFEIPFRVGLTSITWSPDNNLVTAAFKLKRKELADFYREDLRRLYK